jgi:hypothetical protein
MARVIRLVCRILILFAMLGLAGSLIAHGLTLAGSVPGEPTLELLYRGGATLGMAVALMGLGMHWRHRGRNWWETADSASSTRASWLTAAFIAYSLVNFALVYVGSYVDSPDRGQRARQAARVGTGHMMAFYSGGLAGLYVLHAANNRPPP